MNTFKKKVLAICGSTRINSSNMQMINAITNLSSDYLDIEVYDKLSQLPHFNPDLDNEDVDMLVHELRNKITEAGGVLICTPEYVFSLPGSLKNALEWTVSTIIFSDKQVALITASGLGEKAHESLQLIMKTLGAKCNEDAQLLISGARTKVNTAGEITDAATLDKIKVLISSFIQNMNN